MSGSKGSIPPYRYNQCALKFCARAQEEKANAPRAHARETRRGRVAQEFRESRKIAPPLSR